MAVSGTASNIEAKQWTMDDDRLVKLIEKYLEGTCTAAEKQIVEDWYAAQEAHEALFYKGDKARIKRSAGRSLVKIRAALGLPGRPSNTRVRALRITAVAASILVIFGAGFYFSKSRPPAVPYNEIVAAAGHITHITLDDQTVIWLNAGSRLKYPQTPDLPRYEVFLEGEAYFEVAKNPARSFIVHTPHLTTTVLGTIFTVTAYKNMPVQAVTVLQGKVQVNNAHQLLGLLTPDKRTAYNTGNGESRLSDVTAAATASWKDGKLQFEDQEMQDIAARLGRWYGYAFRFNNAAIRKCRYTASFDNKIPLPQLLNIMKAISLVDYRIDAVQKTVTLSGKGCNE